MYAKDRAEYLREHPYCQATIFDLRLDEAEVKLANGYIGVRGRVPYATQIHHRNRGRKKRLLDKRWWLAICPERHEWIECHPATARELGLLLPNQADEQGRWGAGNQALTTPELLKRRHESSDPRYFD